MAVSGKIYGKAFLALFNKEIDWLDDAIKVSLHTSAYSPDQDANDYFDDASNEITGTGYTAGGATLGSKTITYTAGTNKVTLDAANTQWTTSTLTWRTAVVRDAQTGVSTTEPLIGYQTDTADYSTTAGTAEIAWNASGIFEVTVD